MLKIALNIGSACAAMSVVALTASAVVSRIDFATNDSCVGNERLLSLSLSQYIQDYDEQMPPMTNASTFDTALAPYNTAGPSVFRCPVTGQPYVPNPTLGHRSLASFADASSVEVFQDSVRHPYGQFTSAYLDSSIRYGGVLQGDPNWLCVNRAKSLALAVAQYTQDYDQRLPPMYSQTVFQKAVLPYAKSTQTFICPATGLAYVPNPALSFAVQWSIANPHTTVLFKEPKSHNDGFSTIAYADFHVTHGNLGQPQTSDGGQIRQLGLAIIQYSQDYDEVLPPLDTYAHFEQALLPYTGNSSTFTSPDSGLNYQINSSLNGQNLASIASPSTTWITQDAVVNNDGTFNTGYVDGHTTTQYYYHPSELTTGADHNPALVWLKSPYLAVPGVMSQSIQVWDLSPAGGHSGTVSFNAPGIFLGTHAISQVATVTGNQRIIAGGFGTQNTTLPLNGLITVSGTNSTGNVTSTFEYGPFDGWQFLAISAGGSSGNEILARRYDGTLGLLAITSTGAFQTAHRLPSSINQTPTGFVASTDGTFWILFSDSNGNAELWRTNHTGAVFNKYTYANGSAQPVGLATTPLQLPVLLWKGSHGAAQAWTLALNGNITSIASMSMPAQWTASQIGVNSAGNYVVLWTAPGDYAAIECVKPNGTVVSANTYAPFQ